MLSEILLEKLEVIHTHYPWYGGAVVHVKNISCSVYPPPHIRVKHDSRWIINMFILFLNRYSVNHTNPILTALVRSSLHTEIKEMYIGGS